MKIPKFDVYYLRGMDDPYTWLGTFEAYNEKEAIEKAKTAHPSIAYLAKNWRTIKQ